MRWSACSSWPNGCGIPADVRGTPNRPTTRSRATCSKRRTRWWRRSRRSRSRATHRWWTSLATCSTRSCSTRCSPRRPASSPWLMSPAASTTSWCADTRTCSATSWRNRRLTSCATGNRSRRTRRARRRSSRASRPGLPSLLYTHKLFRKAASVGLDPGDLGEALDRIDLAVARLRAGGDDLEADLAQVLAAAVVVARAGGVDAESALRGWAATYRRRFAAMEQLARRDLDLAALDAVASWPCDRGRDHP